MVGDPTGDDRQSHHILRRPVRRARTRYHQPRSRRALRQLCFTGNLKFFFLVFCL